nr:hypothetical protein [Nocardioides carbamazepini]
MTGAASPAAAIMASCLELIGAAPGMGEVRQELLGDGRVQVRQGIAGRWRRSRQNGSLSSTRRTAMAA